MQRVDDASAHEATQEEGAGAVKQEAPDGKPRTSHRLELKRKAASASSLQELSAPAVTKRYPTSLESSLLTVLSRAETDENGEFELKGFSITTARRAALAVGGTLVKTTGRPRGRPRKGQKIGPRGARSKYIIRAGAPPPQPVTVPQALPAPPATAPTQPFTVQQEVAKLLEDFSFLLPPPPLAPIPAPDASMDQAALEEENRALRVSPLLPMLPCIPCLKGDNLLLFSTSATCFAAAMSRPGRRRKRSGDGRMNSGDGGTVCLSSYGVERRTTPRVHRTMG
jgi:hypothetical protein